MFPEGVLEPEPIHPEPVLRPPPMVDRVAEFEELRSYIERSRDEVPTEDDD